MRSYRLHESGVALFTALVVCASLGTPTIRSANATTRCQNALKLSTIQVHATGIEEDRDWAIVKLGGFQEDVVAEGEEFRGCYRLESVREKSVVLKNLATREQREVFLAGYSSSSIRSTPASPTTNDDFVEAAMEKHAVVRESATVDRIEYPQSANSAHLPKLVYHNRAGSSFYGDYRALGIGERLNNESAVDSSSHIEGVRINEPSKESFLGSLGLKDGQKIVAINGHFVRSPEEISRLLEDREGKQLSLGYYDPETRMILSTHGIINSM